MDQLQRVLVVDDDEDIRQIASLALGAVGQLEVRCCASAEEALETLHSYVPDVLLLDVEMPGTSGPELLASQQGAGTLDGLCIVLLTARSPDSVRQATAQLGAVDVISKPFDPMQLADQVRTIWSDNRRPG